MARDLDPAVLSITDAKTALADATALKTWRRRWRPSWRCGWPPQPIGNARASRRRKRGWRRTGTFTAAAKERLETAERLRELPDTDRAASNGDLSAEQAAAVSEAAAADPSAEQRLLDSARTKPLNRLRDDCARVKRRADRDPDATHRRVRAGRHLRFATTLDGAVRLFGASTPEQIATIKTTVDKRANQLFDQARREGRHEPRDAYLIDALEQICAEWLTGTPAATTSAGGAGAKPVPKLPYLGLLRVDLDALRRGSVDGDERCEITGLGPIPVATARQLLGDAVLKLVITRGVDVLHVTHLGRGPTTAQKIALLWESPGCCITACHRMAGIEHDHRIDDATTHHTVLAELDRLCDHHHDLKTLKHWAAVRTDGGQTVMVPPDDPRHPRHPCHRPPSGGDGTDPGPPPPGNALFDANTDTSAGTAA